MVPDIEVGVTSEVALLIADVYELAGAFRRSGEAIAATEGQTQARWQALSVLSGGPMTVPRAARRLGITRQALQRVANELARDGLVVFRDNPDHRSSPLATLTSSGEATLSRITSRAAKVNRMLGRRVGAAALSRTREDIAQLRAAIDG